MARTVEYHRPGHVSLWVGAFPNIDEADAWFTEPGTGTRWAPSPFAVALGLGYFPPEKLEINFTESVPRPLGELLRDATFSSSFLDAAVEAARRKGLTRVQGHALLYDFDYQAKPDREEIVGPLWFIGTFPYDHLAPSAQVRPLYDTAEALGLSQAAVHFVLMALHEVCQDRREQTGAGHVSAMEFCDYLLRCRGADTRDILREYKLTRSEVVGRIVFALIDTGMGKRRDTETEEEFRGLFAL